MNIRYIQPETDQNETSRKIRGKLLNLQIANNREEQQIEANLKRVAGQVDCLRCAHKDEPCEHTSPNECPRFERFAFHHPHSWLATLVVLLVAGCGVVAPEVDSLDAGDASVIVDSDTCDRGSWTVQADNTLAPDMWAGSEVVCVKIQELTAENAALWTCHAACADVVVP